MADTDSGPLSFKGTSPEECEAFVSTIRQRALAQGKHRDEEWIAFFASSYFVGDALYWYEELDEDVQKDWSRLRPALLARFGRGGLTSAPTSSPSTIPAWASSNSIPTPAAAPPTRVPHSLVRKGYLKVLNSNGNLRGYLAKTLTRRGAYLGLSRSLSEGLLISFPALPTDEAFEIKIINPSQSPQTSDTLAVTWPNLPGNKWMESQTYIARCCSFLTVTSKWEWRIDTKVWKLSTEGELSVEYPKPGGGTETLHCSFESGVRFCRSVPDESNSARIAFEDVA